MKRHCVWLGFVLIGCAVPAGHRDSGGVASDSGPGTYQVVHGWPILPEGFAFGHVPGVGVDSHNHVFVFHRGDRPIICFEAETGEIVFSFGDDMFSSAHGLEVDPEDNVWVTDTETHRVYKFSHDGELLMTLGVKDEPGADEAHFDQPTDVAVAPNGDFYVSDGYGNSRIIQFSKEGRRVREWGTKGTDPGQFDLPHGITLDDQQRVYVADRANGRIQVFDSEGQFLREWKSDRLGRPWGLEIGQDAVLYVADGGDMNDTPPDRGRIVKVAYSGPNRPLIPIESGHLFRGKPAGDSGAK